jgi:hypothetical protein
MAQRTQQERAHLGDSDGSPHSREKDHTLDGNHSSAPAYPDSHDSQTGEVHDPYGGKKLGMVRVSIVSVYHDPG